MALKPALKPDNDAPPAGLDIVLEKHTPMMQQGLHQ